MLTHGTIRQVKTSSLHKTWSRLPWGGDKVAGRPPPHSPGIWPFDRLQNRKFSGPVSFDAGVSWPSAQEIICQCPQGSGLGTLDCLPSHSTALDTPALVKVSLPPPLCTDGTILGCISSCLFTIRVFCYFAKKMYSSLNGTLRPFRIFSTQLSLLSLQAILQSNKVSKDIFFPPECVKRKYQNCSCSRQVAYGWVGICVNACEQAGTPLRSFVFGPDHFKWQMSIASDAEQSLLCQR